jgi:uncharacterized protein
MSNAVLIVTPDNVELEPGKIPIDWILKGSPSTCSKILTRSHDWLENMVVWECTAGTFHWHYNQDEAVMVLSGEAIMTTEKGEQRRFGAGDFGFFPAGTSCTWCVPDHFRKVAVLKESVGRPFGFSLKVCNKLLRMAGVVHRSPIIFAPIVVALCAID